MSSMRLLRLPIDDVGVSRTGIDGYEGTALGSTVRSAEQQLSHRRRTRQMKVRGAINFIVVYLSG
jgi:hypothetical protein